MASMLTPTDVAQRWACTPDHVARLCKSGALAAMKLEGRGWRISPEAVEDYERRHTTARVEPSVGGSHRVRAAEARPPAAVLDGEVVPFIRGRVPWRSEIVEDRPALSRGSGAKESASAAN